MVDYDEVLRLQRMKDLRHYPHLRDSPGQWSKDHRKHRSLQTNVIEVG